MISYHPASAAAPVGQHFTRGFQTVDTNEPKRIAVGISTYAWSPTIFGGGHRLKENFLFADWVALDFEDPEFSLSDAVKSFSDMIHVIGTTRNHQLSKDGAPPIDRFRVLLRLAGRCESLADYEFTLRKIGRRYPIDVSCVDGARHFFRCLEIISFSAEGYHEEILAAPPKPTRDERLAHLARAHAGAMPPWVAGPLLHGVPQGQRNNACYRLGCQLAELGFSLEDALSRVMASPLSAIGAERLIGSVTNGFRRVQAEMEALYGGSDPNQSGEEKGEDPDQRGLCPDREHDHGDQRREQAGARPKLPSL